MENHTSKHFVLQLGSLASLYLSLSFLLVLVFGIINMAIPDATDSYWQVNTYSEGIRLGIAILIVFFPTYLVLTRMVNINRRRSNDSNYLGLTKWLIYLSLLVGGAVLLGDLVAVIMAFLDGEVTTRFFLKAVSVLVVVGSAFAYYIYDAKGYWIQHEKKSKFYGLIAGAIVLTAIVAGFIYTESPSESRERALDETQLTDLREAQWRVQDYLAINNELPPTLKDAYRGGKTPEAPENRPDYEYNIIENGFELCATFAAANDPEEYSYARPLLPTDNSIPTIINPDDWGHEAGFYCFERVVKGVDEKTTSADTE